MYFDTCGALSLGISHSHRSKKNQSNSDEQRVRLWLPAGSLGEIQYYKSSNFVVTYVELFSVKKMEEIS